MFFDFTVNIDSGETANETHTPNSAIPSPNNKKSLKYKIKY